MSQDDEGAGTPEKRKRQLGAGTTASKNYENAPGHDPVVGGVMTAPIEILEALDTLGVRCRDTLAAGNAAIVEAARLAVMARLRIERDGEDYAGGFIAWWDAYCIASPWPAPKLLTAAGWRDAKKTGVVPEPAQIAANVERLKSDQRRDQKKSRDGKNSLTSDKTKPAPVLKPIEPAPAIPAGAAKVSACITLQREVERFAKRVLPIAGFHLIPRAERVAAVTRFASLLGVEIRIVEADDQPVEEAPVVDPDEAGAGELPAPAAEVVVADIVAADAIEPVVLDTTDPEAIGKRIGGDLASRAFAANRKHPPTLAEISQELGRKAGHLSSEHSTIAYLAAKNEAARVWAQVQGGAK